MAEILQYILLYRMRVPIKHLSPSPLAVAARRAPRVATNGVWRRQTPLDARCVCVCLVAVAARRRAVFYGHPHTGPAFHTRIPHPR